MTKETLEKANGIQKEIDALIEKRHAFATAKSFVVEVRGIYDRGKADIYSQTADEALAKEYIKDILLLIDRKHEQLEKELAEL